MVAETVTSKLPVVFSAIFVPPQLPEYKTHFVASFNAALFVMLNVTSVFGQMLLAELLKTGVSGLWQQALNGSVIVISEVQVPLLPAASSAVKVTVTGLLGISEQPKVVLSNVKEVIPQPSVEPSSSDLVC